jgi:uncharacterized protein YbjT (DUF2867 family)
MSQSTSHKILVVGASGTVASEVVRLLRAQGHAVRGTTGKPSSDPDTVTLNLLTGEGLDAAFAGVERAFFLSPGGYADQYKIFAPLIAKSKAAGLKKVVLMTAIGVEQNPEAPMRRAEVDLEKSGVPYNIIRPSWFMQNFNTFWGHGIKAQGQIRLPVADGKAAFIDSRDISAVAAKLLTDDTLNNLAFTLTGPEPLTHAQVAALISEAAGKPVSFVDIEPQELKQGLLAGGVPADYTELLLMLLGFLKAGYVATRNDSVLEILGRPPRDFKAYARDYAANWK